MRSSSASKSNVDIFPQLPAPTHLVLFPTLAQAYARRDFFFVSVPFPLLSKQPRSALRMEYMAQCQRTGPARRRLIRVASQMPGVEYALEIKAARTSF